MIVDRKLDEYIKLTRALEQSKQEIKTELETTEKVIVFMDLVGSTEFKIMNSTEPWIWIARLSHFYEITYEHVTKRSGSVVKFIGDEAMASFPVSEIASVTNLMKDLPEIETEMMARTGYPARIKIAADVGKIYEFKIIDHAPPDPQGTPVDRCARIAKWCKPSTVLISEELYGRILGIGENPSSWSRLKQVEARGIGTITIYQLGEGRSVEEPPTPESRMPYDNLTPFQRFLLQRHMDSDEAMLELQNQGRVMEGPKFASMMQRELLKRELLTLPAGGTVLAVCGHKKLIEETYYQYFYDYAKRSYQSENGLERIRVCRIFIPDETGFSIRQDRAMKGHDKNKEYGVRAVRIPIDKRKGMLEHAWGEAIAQFNSDYGFGYVLLLHQDRFVGYTHELADLKSQKLRICAWHSDSNGRELIELFSELLEWSEWRLRSTRSSESSLRDGLDSLLRDYLA